MKLSGRAMSCCVALLLVLLRSLSDAHKRLDSIDDLKEIDFGESVPKHSLILLYWFANAVDIDSNNVIWLEFDPNRRDYGSHHYGNFEGMLDYPPWRSKYYTIGSLNQGTSQRRLPSYVVSPRREYSGGNSDRIIIRVQEQNTGCEVRQRIDEVFITQHNGTSEYDPAHTYEITTNLLRQIRQFSVGEHGMWNLRHRFGSNADHFQLEHIRNTWGHLACLGLLLFIVIQERYSFNQQSVIQQSLQIHWDGGGASCNRESGMHNYSEPSTEEVLCCLFGIVFICFVLYAIIVFLKMIIAIGSV